MRICKIWDADYPWDIRVEKVSESLVDAGHTVHLVCRNAGRLPRYDGSGKFSIHRLPAISPILGPLHDLCNFPHPLNPVWIYNISRVVRHHQIQLILVRDLPLALAAILVGRLHGIPVVLDMAENYPAMLQDRLRFTQTSWIGRLVRQPALARIIEMLVLRLVNHIIVVVEESRDRLIADGVPREKLTVVSNTPRIDHWDATGNERKILGTRSGIHVVYLGNLDGSRGVDIAVRAIGYLKSQGRHARLSIVGQGPARPLLEKLITGLDIQDRVMLKGRLPFRDVQTILAESDVGLIPHYSTEAWNTTMPNKLFDYMLWGMPVLVSDVKPVASIVRAERCGKVFEDRNVEDLARCIMGLQDSAVRDQMGANGRASIYRRYNWKIDGEVFVKAIEGMVA